MNDKAAFTITAIVIEMAWRASQNTMVCECDWRPARTRLQPADEPAVGDRDQIHFEPREHVSQVTGPRLGQV
jgi:hypothetical protein